MVKEDWCLGCESSEIIRGLLRWLRPGCSKVLSEGCSLIGQLMQKN